MLGGIWWKFTQFVDFCHKIRTLWWILCKTCALWTVMTEWQFSGGLSHPPSQSIAISLVIKKVHHVMLYFLTCATSYCDASLNLFCTQFFFFKTVVSWKQVDDSFHSAFFFICINFPKMHNEPMQYCTQLDLGYPAISYPDISIIRPWSCSIYCLFSTCSRKKSS